MVDKTVKMGRSGKTCQELHPSRLTGAKAALGRPRASFRLMSEIETVIRLRKHMAEE